MSPRKQGQKVPTEDELKDFELRKREATQINIPPPSYAGRPVGHPPALSRYEAPAQSYGRSSSLVVVAAFVAALLFVTLGVLLYWVWS